MKKILLIITLIFIIMLTNCIVIVKGIPSFDRELKENLIYKSRIDTDNKILQIKIIDYISNRAAQGMFVQNISTVDMVKFNLEYARQEEDIIGVLLIISTPGGSASASDCIYNLIQEFRNETGKPVIAYIEDIGTSGGYYISCAANKIVCDPTALTGNIGVIAWNLNFHKLLDKWEIDSITYKSGENKDMGNPFEPVTESENNIFNGIIDELFDKFIKIVTENRNIDETNLNEIKDGRILTAKQALKYNLVDKIGYFKDAEAICLKLAGIKNADIIEFSSTIDQERNLLYKPDTYKVEIMKLLSKMYKNTYPKFMYIWLP